MNSILKNSGTNEVHEGFHLFGTIALVLLILFVVAGSFYMFIMNAG